MKQIITTVGTSLFTNYRKSDVKEGFNKSNKRYFGVDDSTFEKLLLKPAFEYKHFHRELNEIKSIIKDNWFKGIIRTKDKKWILKEHSYNTFASAEIKSLFALSQKDKYKKEDIIVHLLATDTVLSRLAAELIREWFEEYNKENVSHIKVYFDSEKNVCKSLQVTDGELFEREGIPNLINLCDRIVAGNYSNSIINITGGYKAVLPYMTIYAQINNIPLYYIFEETENLIFIPQAPISINWSMFEKYSDVIEDLEKGIYNWSKYKNKELILEDFSECIWIDEKDDLAALNSIGELFYNKYKIWRVVKVISGGPFLSLRKSSSEKFVHSAIETLYIKLSDFIRNNNLESKSEEEVFKYLRENGGDNLNHANINVKNCFIYKHPVSINEVRLLYTFGFKNGKLIDLKILDFRVDKFEHSSYIDEFKKFAINNYNKNFVPYLQIKGE